MTIHDVELYEEEAHLSRTVNWLVLAEAPNWFSQALRDLLSSCEMMVTFLRLLMASANQLFPAPAAATIFKPLTASGIGPANSYVDTGEFKSLGAKELHHQKNMFSRDTDSVSICQQTMLNACSFCYLTSVKATRKEGSR